MLVLVLVPRDDALALSLVPGKGLGLVLLPAFVRESLDAIQIVAAWRRRALVLGPWSSLVQAAGFWSGWALGRGPWGSDGLNLESSGPCRSLASPVPIPLNVPTWTSCTDVI